MWISSLCISPSFTLLLQKQLQHLCKVCHCKCSLSCAVSGGVQAFSKCIYAQIPQNTWFASWDSAEHGGCILPSGLRDSPSRFPRLTVCSTIFNVFVQTLQSVFVHLDISPDYDSLDHFPRQICTNCAHLATLVKKVATYQAAQVCKLQHSSPVWPPQENFESSSFHNSPPSIEATLVSANAM